MIQDNNISPHEIRSAFTKALSDMYRHEVPLYGALLNLVQTINQQILANDTSMAGLNQTTDPLERLSAEHHGAIRLGSAQELFNMRRLFAVMDMHPVAYYDLSTSGLPVHSTAFRPITLEALNANPFRVFTSLLRLELLSDPVLHEKAQFLMAQRQILTPGALELIEIYESNQGLNENQAEQFILEALETFRWHKQAKVDFETYQQFLEAHPLVADIVCFHGPHINHLTPGTLDIEACQQAMIQQSMHPKEIIEGPPARSIPILLRQTSFRALSEPVDFFQADGTVMPASHTARFGEIEQRGMALTPKGRKLYDKLLIQSNGISIEHPQEADDFYSNQKKVFADFPDNAMELHNQALGYFQYELNPQDDINVPVTLEHLITSNTLVLIPLTYEDFLPVSAAGIFRSNLQHQQANEVVSESNQHAFERDLGCPVINEFDIYRQIQQESLTIALQKSTLTHSDRQQVMNQFEQLYR